MQANTATTAAPKITHQELVDATIDDADYTARAIMSDVLTVVDECGYELKAMEDIGLVFETIRSMLLRSMGVPHFLQKVADKYVYVKD